MLLNKLLIATVLFSPVAWASTPLKPVDLSSPRDTMHTFIQSMNQYKQGVIKSNSELESKIEKAIRTLNLENTPYVLRVEKGRETVKLLKEVIDRVKKVSFNEIPKQGDADLWRFPGTEITISRVKKGERAGEFLFSPETVFRAKEFYSKVKHLPYIKGTTKGALYKEPWLEEHVPKWAKNKIFLFENYQWIGLFLIIFLSGLFKKVVRFLTLRIKSITKKTTVKWDDQIIDALEKPVGSIAACAFLFFSIHALHFEGKALYFFTVIIQVLFSVALIQAAYRSVDVFTEYLFKFTKKTEPSLDDQLIPLIKKAVRFFVLVFGILMAIQNLGFNVMSILAGLGLGGLAFALAAKDTCANLFGSFMIFFDQPFKVGDWAVIGSQEGVVESIGFRSTRIRTFHNSLISIPNSTVANTEIDNMGKRAYRRVVAHLGLTYDTPPEKMEAFLEGVKNIIKANKTTRKDYFHVVFNKFSDSSLEVMLYFFLKVPDWSQEVIEKQNIYLEILRLAKEIDVDFAFPTQTLHVETFPEKQPGKLQQSSTKESLSQKAESFGPKGVNSQPAGLGIFTPPFQEK